MELSGDFGHSSECQGRQLTSDGETQDPMPETRANVVPLQDRAPFRVIGPEGRPLEEWGHEDLMLEHGRGSEAAFELLLRRHQKGVLNYMFRMVQNRHVAEELTQAGTIVAHANHARFSSEYCTLKAIETLEKAVAAGLDSPADLGDRSSLASLRKDRRFAELVNQ